MLLVFVPEDKGSAKVYYYDGYTLELERTDFPKDMELCTGGLKSISEELHCGRELMKSKYIISTDGAKIAYNIFDKGFPRVLVHDMGSNLVSTYY